MGNQVRLVRIFFAAPSDVHDELEIARQLLNDWNRTSGQHTKQHAELIHWTTHATPEMGSGPQEAINRQLLDESDLVVGIFWSRFGSSTSKARSGTEEEIRRSIKGGRPVLLYFSNVAVKPSDLDQKQYARVTAFRKEFQKRGLYRTYDNKEEFKSLLRDHLFQKLNDLPKGQLESLRVAIAVVCRGHKVLMVRRREPEEGLEWQFPAGIVKPRASGRKVAVEEVKSETGVKCEVVKTIGDRVHPDTGATTEYYLCRYAAGKATNRDHLENAEVRWVDTAEVDKLVTSDLFRSVGEELARITKKKRP